MNATRHIVRLLTLAAFASAATACDTGEEEPVQTIEDNVSQEGVDLLLEVAELEPEADFAIYTVVLPDMPQYGLAPLANDAPYGGPSDQINSNYCPFPDAGPVGSTCGWCGCDPQLGGIICVDYQCNPTGQTFRTEQAFTSAPEADLHGSNAGSDTCEPGATWQDDCNACKCLADGTKACTLMACDPGDWLR